MSYNLASAPMRDSCDFKWGTSHVSKEFGSLQIAEISVLAVLEHLRCSRRSARIVPLVEEAVPMDVYSW